MSLINKMLQDLDRRTGSAAKQHPMFSHSGLHPVTGISRRSARGLWLTGVFALLIAGAGFGAYGWLQQTPQHMAAATGAKAESDAESIPVVAQQAKKKTETKTKTVVAKAAPPQAKAAVEKPAKPATTASRKSTKPATKTAKKPSPAKTQRLRQAKSSSKRALALGNSTNSGVSKTMRAMTPLEQATGLYQQALDKMQSEPLAAQQQLRSALAIYPLHVQARELLVTGLLQQGQWQAAQQLLADGIKAVPTYYRFAQWQARLQAEHGRQQQALAVLERSRSYAAGDPDYLALLGALYQRSGQHAKAAEAYQQAVGAQPARGKLWLGLAISLEAEKNYQGARNAYQRATISGLDDKLQHYARQRLSALQ